MIDIHSHIIPYVDDGAQSWDEAIELLRQGEQAGVEAVVATPHILAESDYEKVESDIISKFGKLRDKARAAGIKMEMYLGCEIYIQPDMTLTHKISTFNNNELYFLVEFPMSSIPKFAAEKFFTYIVEGKLPIIAHPERNAGFIERRHLAYEFVQRGALMQVNASSLLGRHGNEVRETALNLVEHNLVHFVASDCHGLNHRTMKSLATAYELVCDQFGVDTANRLFKINPLKVIQGEKIDTAEPVPMRTQTNNSFWQKMGDLIRSHS
ncbi:MAG: CpsB/CapC family capsule biosynthesis tyrosine phosphatase [candidate division KSB1 bacterium]|jgi:protein-tyrosine phosphatase|nr:CpsB/CapC family capsule biosynthesis tyrosine phosphatase [candidate division KSB1 bacterium]